MNKIKVAVIGAGHIGKFHAQKYRSHPSAQLVAVVDKDLVRANELARDCCCKAFTSLEQIDETLNAVSIATPATSHFAVAHSCLNRGWHCFIEKPICSNLKQAEQIVAAATSKNLKLQVGHSERFNPAFIDLQKVAINPRFITTERLAEFNPRVGDVDVILDLMIHDIDLIINLANSKVESVQASGSKIFSQSIDIAHAYLRFTSGCVASLTASRVSSKRNRVLRVFDDDFYANVQLDSSRLSLSCLPQDSGKFQQKLVGGSWQTNQKLALGSLQHTTSDVIKLEVDNFIDAIRDGKQIKVSGKDGARALEIALQIQNYIARQA